MTKPIKPPRLAGTAIAAFRALSSTSLWAQEIPAPADVVASAPVSQPASTIVLPIPTEAASAPVLMAAPVAPEATTPRDVTRSAAAPRAATGFNKPPAPLARTAVAVPVVVQSAIAETFSLARVAAANALPADLAGPQVVNTSPASKNVSNDLLLAGLAGVLGLGAIGLFAATRRRRPTLAENEAAYEVEPELVTVAPQRYATLAAPVFTPITAWSEPRVPQAQPSDCRALNLNRYALLDRMVTAEPDSNNPFTSGKGRRGRARLMLQSMDNQRWEDAELAPGFDWREMAEASHKRETIDA